MKFKDYFPTAKIGDVFQIIETRTFYKVSKIFKKKLYVWAHEINTIEENEIQADDDMEIKLSNKHLPDIIT